MKLPTFVFLIYICISAQTVNIFVEKKTNADKFAKFEKELMQSFIDFRKLSNSSSYKINFIEMSLDRMLSEILKYKNTDLVMAINSISVTEERKLKYDFSTPYMINRPIILRSRLNKKPKDLENKSSVFGTINGSIYESILIKDLKKTQQKIVLTKTFIELIEKLNRGEIDFIYTDYVNIWSFDLEPVKELDIGSLDQIAILFPKNSLLCKLINSDFEKFLKTENFMSLIKKHFGTAAINYFQRGLKKHF